MFFCRKSLKRQGWIAPVSSKNLFQIAPKSSPLLTTTTIKNIKTNKFSFLWIFFFEKNCDICIPDRNLKNMKISRQKIISWWFCCVCQFDARVIFVGLFGRDGKRCDKGNGLPSGFSFEFVTSWCSGRLIGSPRQRSRVQDPISTTNIHKGGH